VAKDYRVSQVYQSDPELAALRLVYCALVEIDRDAQIRVLDYVQDRLDKAAIVGHKK